MAIMSFVLQLLATELYTVEVMLAVIQLVLYLLF